MLLVSFATVYAQSDNDNYQLQWEANSLKALGAGSDIGSVTRNFINFPKDDNGQTTALLRIKVKNMAVEDAQKLKATVSTGIAQLVKEEFHLIDGMPERWLYVSPETFQVNVFAIGYKSPQYAIDTKLESSQIYTLTLNCVKQINVTFTTSPKDVVVYVDQKRMVENKGRLSSGMHKVSFSRNGSNMNKDTTITVSEQNYVFNFDLRPQYTVKVTSNPRGADVKVIVSDNKETSFGKTPASVTLPEGSYTMITHYRGEMSDTTVLKVSEYTSELHIQLEKKKQVEFYANYQGHRERAYLRIRRIDGTYIPETDAIEGQRMSFNLWLPYGKYEVTMSNNHNHATRVIRVDEGSQVTYSIDIKPPKATFVWPWDRDFEEHVAGFHIGYVQRTLYLSVKEDEGEYYETYDPVWDREGKAQHGIRTGIHFQPSYRWGLGLYMGVFFEYYYSPSPNSTQTYDENGSIADWYTSFTEKAISVPLHLYFRIPFSNQFSLYAHGGVDADYFFGATYKDKNNTITTYTPSYGDGWEKKHLNLSYTVAAGLQYGSLMAEVSWAWGMTNQDLTERTWVDISRINRLHIGLSFLF